MEFRSAAGKDMASLFEIKWINRRLLLLAKKALLHFTSATIIIIIIISAYKSDEASKQTNKHSSL